MFYDISQKISASTAVWPGDTPFSSRRVMEIAHGMSCNVTTITMSVHCGSHADAPLHYEDGGPSAGELALGPYLGRARVHWVRSEGKNIGLEDLPSLDGVERLLLRCYESVDESQFHRQFRPLSVEAAEAIARAKIQLVGIDGQSMDAFDSKNLPVHHLLRAHRVAILENLDLSEVPEGDYELIALPLRLMGIDASPVRAVLRGLQG